MKRSMVWLRKGWGWDLGLKLTRMDMDVLFKEGNTLLKIKYEGKWEKEHQGYNKEEGYCQLNRD
jgi:hypothetical protein